MKFAAFKPNGCILTAFLVLIGCIWFCFGEDFLTAKQLFRRFGVEMPATASNIVVDDQEDAMVIAFRLTPNEATDFVARTLPGYSGWRRQGTDESFPSLGGIPPTDLHRLMVNEKRAGSKLWTMLVHLPTGECFALYDVDAPPPVAGGVHSL